MIDRTSTFSPTPFPRRRRAIVTAVAAALMVGAGLTNATDYVVDTTDDPADPNVVDGTVSLREAVMAASTNAAVGDAPAGEADGDTITFNLTLPATISLNSEISVSDDVVIDGDTSNGGSGVVVPPDGVILSGQGASRIFNIDVGDSEGDVDEVLLEDLTLVDGSADRGGAILSTNSTLSLTGVDISDSEATGAAATDGGGAIYNDGGTLNVVGGEISGNMAIVGSGSGGALFNNAGVLSVTDAAFTANVANRAGGAIEQVDGVATLSGVEFSGNNAGVEPAATAAPGNGGAMHITGTGDASIMGGSVSANVAAAEGGGFWNSLGEMIVSGVDENTPLLIDQNVASGDASDQGGGGLFNNGGTLTVSNVTLMMNTADGAAGSGGGVLSDGGTLTLTNVTLESNTSVRAGGGIEIDASDGGVDESTVSLTNVNMTSNGTGPAPGNGGGLHITGGNVAATIGGGDVSMNTAASEGGGLWNGSGTMTVDGTNVQSNTASGADADQGGGGLFNAGGTLNVLNATVSSNTADGAAGSGGGILNDAGGTLNVTGTVIDGNSAARAGGGIEDNSSVALGSVALVDTDITNNVAGANPGNGGGVHGTGPGSFAIAGGHFTGNQSDNEGGALWTADASLVVTGANIAGNTSPKGGGVFKDGTAGSVDVVSTTIWNNEGDEGGGLFSEGGDVSLTNATVSGNRAVTGNGGGIKSQDGTVNLMSVTIAANSAEMGGGADNTDGGDIVAMNTIFADNTATLAQDVNGTLTSQDYLVIENGKGLAINGLLNNVILGVDPKLDRLADNGGSTLTHALLEGSVAIDNGSCDALLTDQRGSPRDDLACDMGAYEAGGIGEFLRDLIFGDNLEGNTD